MDVIVNFAYTLQIFCSLDLKAVCRVGPKFVPDGETASGNLSSINVSRSNQLMDVLFLCSKSYGGEEINFHFELCFIPRPQVVLCQALIKKKKNRNWHYRLPDCPFKRVFEYLLGFPFDMQRHLDSSNVSSNLSFFCCFLTRSQSNFNSANECNEFHC